MKCHQSHCTELENETFWEKYGCGFDKSTAANRVHIEIHSILCVPLYVIKMEGEEKNSQALRL